MKIYTVWVSVITALLLNNCLGEELRFESNDKGQLSALEYRNGDSWKSIPFRTDGWGTSWYVRDRDGKSRAITLAPKQNEADSYEGRAGDIVFGLSYALLDGSLAIKASISNTGESDFRPMTAGIRLGFDSYQAEYPTWKKKLIPNVIRCERSHHWGFAMSPDGAILGWACDTPVASYSINFEDRLHRIHTANIDFINRLPLPAHHPQNLDVLAAGQTREWTVRLLPIASEEEIKPRLAELIDAPIFDSDFYTIDPAGEANIRIYGPELQDIFVTLPQGGTTRLEVASYADGSSRSKFAQHLLGLYTFRALDRNGREASGSIFVRRPWAWYLKQARLEGLRVKPTETHHAECVYPFFSYFLARKYYPEADIDAQCETVFDEYFPQHYDFEQNKLKVDWRIQDTAIWASILADRYEVTGDEKDLEYAAHLADFLISKQKDDGGYYRQGKVHYTCVIYLAKSIMEVMTQEKKLAADSEVWRERYERHRNSVDRALADLKRRRDRVETEGQQTFEDGMISCAMTQLAMYALKAGSSKDVSGYIDSAEYLFDGHRCLTLKLHPDARVNGSTIRFWETQYTICVMDNMYNSPCGWSAWKLYGNYYLYLLSGEEQYLQDAFNGLGACVQLIDSLSGRMRWGFTPDPFIYTRWAIEAAPGTEKREHDWVTGVRGEEYLEMISDWNRTKPIWRQKKWGIDNFVHEIFKCMEEMALGNAYLLQREDGSYVGYNCKVESTGDSLTVMPLEDSISRLHLNLRRPTLLKASIGGENIEGSYDGMQWIGPGGIPQDIRPFMKLQASGEKQVE